jgi:hypothetical protein
LLYCDQRDYVTSVKEDVWSVGIYEKLMTTECNDPMGAVVVSADFDISCFLHSASGRNDGVPPVSEKCLQRE